MNVYVVTGGRRHVKIGVAHDVQKRLKGIQTGCPFRVRLVHSWNTGRAREIEQKAHKLLWQYRWAGEWFGLPPRVAVLTVGMLVAAYPSRSGQDAEIERAVVFCRSCEHSAALRNVPAKAARLRCSKCERSDQVHVITVKTERNAQYLRRAAS